MPCALATKSPNVSALECLRCPLVAGGFLRREKESCCARRRQLLAIFRQYVWPVEVRFSWIEPRHALAMARLFLEKLAALTALGRVARHPAGSFIIGWRHTVVSIAVLIAENLLGVLRTSGLLSVLMRSRTAASSGIACGAPLHRIAWHPARPFVIGWRHSIVGVAVLIAENLLGVLRATGLLRALMGTTAATASGVGGGATLHRVTRHSARPFVI